MRYNLPKRNALLLAGAFLVIVLGFALMVGAPSGTDTYNPEIFSFRRITLGPMIALLGFVLMVVAVLYKGKHDKDKRK